MDNRIRSSMTEASGTARLSVPDGQALVVAVDTLVAGVHFPENAEPFDIGYRSLAVNLSDLAAMGAHPAAFSLSLATPTRDDAWLTQFSRGLWALGQRYDLELAGTTRAIGALTATVQVYGHVPAHEAMRRANAMPGHRIYVTGTLGDAGLALALDDERRTIEPDDWSYLAQRLNRPRPRVTAGIALRGIASAAIDVSDGLGADLGHILTASRVGATLELAWLPLSPVMKKYRGLESARELALSAGDDYELCFTIAPDRVPLLERRRDALDGAITEIGRIEADKGLRCVDANGVAREIGNGYRHF